MRLWSKVLPAVALLGVCTPALAQSDVVVTGERPAEREAAQAYVAAITNTRGGQIARFRGPVCPTVVGLPKSYAAAMVERIRANARGVGAPVAPDGCRANLIVAVVRDGGALVREVRARHGAWLSGLTTDEADELVASPGPVRAWATSTVRNEDGLAQSDSASGQTASGFTGQGVTVANGVPVMRVMSSSFIRQLVRRDLETAYVVIDQAATVGLRLNQIADYATLRGLARTRDPEGAPALGSIISLFEPGASPPAGLSSADRGYLTALYRDNGLSRPAQGRARLASRISRGEAESVGQR